MLTAIWHRGLRNCFFLRHIYFFHILFGLLFPFSIWTFISLFSLDFLFPSIFGLLFPFLFGFFFSIFFQFFQLVFNSFSILFQFFYYSIAVTFWISSKFFCKNEYSTTKLTFIVHQMACLGDILYLERTGQRWAVKSMKGSALNFHLCAATTVYK